MNSNPPSASTLASPDDADTSWPDMRPDALSLAFAMSGSFSGATMRPLILPARCRRKAEKSISSEKLHLPYPSAETLSHARPPGGVTRRLNAPVASVLAPSCSASSSGSEKCRKPGRLYCPTWQFVTATVAPGNGLPASSRILPEITSGGTSFSSNGFRMSEAEAPSSASPSL